MSSEREDLRDTSHQAYDDETGEPICPVCGEPKGRTVRTTDGQGDPYYRFEHGDDWCYALPDELPGRFP